MQNMPIAIFRGDDTDALGYQTIVGTIRTDLDLTGCKAVFKYLSFSVEFNPIPADKKLTVIIPSSETSKFPPGLGYASLRVYDLEGKLCTFSNRIMVFVATKTPMFGNAEFEVDFNVRPELEPLKIFVGPNPDDFDEYRGFLEKVIDRASAEKYGLAMLLDAIDSDLGADDGVAATPVAVKAAYAAIIKKLTDDYYTKEETDEAIDRVAAYYITYDAAGNPFPTYAALANATTVYSGGQVRVPTRNDYCVVLADETHQGAEYRYIYAAAEGQTTGSWQPQFPVEGVMTVDQTVTKDSQNPVSGGGVWSAIWGALSALPTGFSSLYDWCVTQLAGKMPSTATGADIAVSGSVAMKISAALERKVNTYNGVASGLVTYIGAVDGIEYGLRFGSYGSDYAVQIVTRSAGSQTNWTATANLMVQKSKTGYAALLSDIPSVPSASTSTPLMDGTGAAGTSAAFARGDHVHPTDTSRMAATATGADIAVSGTDATKIDAALAGKQSALSAQQLANITAVPGKLDKSGGTMTGSLTLYEPQNGATLYFPSGGKAKLNFGSGLFNVDDVTGRVTINSKDVAVRAANPTAGNLAALDASGNPTDAGWTAGELARYSLVTKTISNGAVSLDDRAINAVAVSSSLASLTVNFPTATSGKARDFGLRLTVASGITTAPELALPQGVTCENADGEAPEIGADGAATILYFTETASGVFLVKGEVLQTITQA